MQHSAPQTPSSLSADPANSLARSRLNAPVVIPRVQPRKRLRRLQSQQYIAMTDGVEDGECREDDLPGSESGEEAVQAAEVEDSRAFGGREEDAGDPEEEDEADL